MNNYYESDEIQELVSIYGIEAIETILKRRKRFYLYFDNFPNLDEMSDKEAGILFKNIVAFEKCKELQGMNDRITAITFSFVEPRLINGLVDFINESFKKAENGSKGGKAKAENAKAEKVQIENSQTEIEQVENAQIENVNLEKYKIPSLTEFVELCASKGVTRDVAEAYHRIFSANGRFETESAEVLAERLIHSTC